MESRVSNSQISTATPSFAQGILNPDGTAAQKIFKDTDDNSNSPGSNGHGTPGPDGDDSGFDN
jgi:hypothetical protein